MRGGLNRSFDTANNFVFTALRGIQSGREYYVAMCQLRAIPKIFLFDEEDIPPEMRAQRALNKARIPEISAYILKSDNYVLSSITASIDGKVEFIPVDEKGPFSRLGTLNVPIGTRFLINDGQHRAASIREALKKNPDLGSETISVVFFLDSGLKRSQQMFTDLNKHAVKPTTSINILYDHRDPFSQAVLSAMAVIPIFANDLTELEKTSISNRVNKVFTLNSIYSASKALLGKTQKRPVITQEEKQLIIDYWTEVYDNISEWKDILNKGTPPHEIRTEYVHVYGILLHALGILGHSLIQQHPNPKIWKSKLRKLQNINWHRSNTKDWEGRCLMNGKLTKIRSNIILTSNLLKQRLQLPLTPAEEQIEQLCKKR